MFQYFQNPSSQSTDPSLQAFKDNTPLRMNRKRPPISLCERNTGKRFKVSQDIYSTQAIDSKKRMADFSKSSTIPTPGRNNALYYDLAKRNLARCGSFKALLQMRMEAWENRWLQIQKETTTPLEDGAQPQSPQPISTPAPLPLPADLSPFVPGPTLTGQPQPSFQPSLFPTPQNPIPPFQSQTPLPSSTLLVSPPTPSGADVPSVAPPSPYRSLLSPFSSPTQHPFTMTPTPSIPTPHTMTHTPSIPTPHTMTPTPSIPTPHTPSIPIPHTSTSKMPLPMPHASSSTPNTERKPFKKFKAVRKV